MDTANSKPSTSDFDAKLVSFILPVVGVLIGIVRLGTGRGGGFGCIAYSVLGAFAYGCVALAIGLYSR